MSSKKYNCHRISEGKASAKAIISTDDIMFYLIEPESGNVVEKGHSLEGRSIAKKILIFPGGKGSSVVQADGLYQLNVEDNMPAAMIIEYPDPVLVASAIVMEVPVVDRVDPEFYEELKEGDEVLVDADQGFVMIL